MKAIMLNLFTLSAVLIAIASPLIGYFVWFIALGILCLGRVIFLWDKIDDMTQIIRVALSSWAYFSLAVFIPKWMLLVNIEHVELYALMVSTVIIGISLQIEAYRTQYNDGFYLIDFFSYAIHYLLFTTILSLLSYFILNTISNGNLDMGYISGIAYGTVYKSGVDILIIQISAVASHLVTSKLHNLYRPVFENVIIYKKDTKYVKNN
ncbi:MAG: hypothetical protein Q7J10_08930 [Methanosarcinaceae archaeon]|nr:hypothetical protein [Methanosarcinaceae archaeon]